MATNSIPKTPSNGFTDAFLQRVKLKSTDKRYELADKDQRGLRLRVSPSGTRTFVWYYRSGNTTKCHTIGQYPSVSLANARKEVRERKVKLMDGVQPLQAIDGDAPKTVRELGEVFYEKRIVAVRKRPDAVRQILDHDIYPVVGSKRLRSVTLQMLGGVIDTVVARGANTHAGKVLAVLKQMFRWGEGRGFIERSPAYAMSADDYAIRSGQKSRALDTDPHGNPLAKMVEIPALWVALDAAPKLSPAIRYGVKVLLLTGVRSQELRLAKWPDVDLKKSVWTIPVSNQKVNPKQMTSAKPWQVPLSPLAIEQFRKLEYYSINQYVMPGKKDGPLTDKAIGRAVRRLFELKASDGSPILPIEKFSPHDLRRTLRSHLDRLEVPLHISESCLNHSLGKIVQTYATSTYLDERREALQKWSDEVSRGI
ncbi:MAG: hypothetical protein OI74_06170 [Gammaproteobacteria bacterium (ex Lamellibrachia satsuma)]|nr:MAG: tyrosine-type recombinase/integrase [Gammaproteobacteria bacterium (ex Lamellibrachia satsuma)]RRS34050.1 MAG: hypothetical protein OI74_06170 [Gammaproteobacteria bacterium (ex Lamellibrachia satsuma)]RRS35807.1 MAG: hypothetical protein NV67_09400 [Gammaproteobacteria bacterium (ex Lamellibrachia satsuma)]